MAFQQPQQRPQTARPIPSPHLETQDIQAAPLSRKRTLDESEEWVLFSPQAPSTTTRTHTTSTDRTPRTAGLSRLSDFGSLDTAARSEQAEEHEYDNDAQIEEEAELDSLDDGLHAFHEPSEYGATRQRLDASGATTMPTHDGLGTFEASSNVVQNQLWQFERYNPRRPRHRRRSSLQRQLEIVEEVEGHGELSEKTRRIEQWRVEQSIALLEEIERETRRMRRISKANVERTRPSSVAAVSDVAQSSPVAAEVAKAEEFGTPSEEQETWWTRFTQRVIRDLMGIDESILSVIFGEDLPDEAKTASDEALTTADMLKEAEMQDTEDSQSEPWEHRLLERIARELGLLVNQLSEHPGAFSTYLRTQEVPVYAGLTSSSESITATDLERENNVLPQSSMPGGFPSVSPGAISANNIQFAPSVPQQTGSSVPYSEASLWGIEEENSDDEADNAPIPGVTDVAAHLRRDKEYWERELDVKMVFNFLKQRFSSQDALEYRTRPSSANITSVPRTSNAQNSQPTYGTSSTPITAARRAALIRQHHPLVGSASAAEGSLKARRLREHLYRQNLQQYGIPHHMRSGSGRLSGSKSASVSVTSVASSHGTRKSVGKRSLSGSSRSRNFWDGQGGGAASVVGSASGLGAWGET